MGLFGKLFGRSTSYNGSEELEDPRKPRSKGSIVALRVHVPTERSSAETFLRQMIPSLVNIAKEHSNIDFSFDKASLFEKEPGICLLQFDCPKSENAQELIQLLTNVWQEIEPFFSGGKTDIIG